MRTPIWVRVTCLRALQLSSCRQIEEVICFFQVSCKHTDSGREARTWREEQNKTNKLASCKMSFWEDLPIPPPPTPLPLQFCIGTSRGQDYPTVDQSGFFKVNGSCGERGYKKEKWDFNHGTARWLIDQRGQGGTQHHSMGMPLLLALVPRGDSGANDFFFPPAGAKASVGVHKNPAVRGPRYSLSRYVRSSRLPLGGDRSPASFLASPGKLVELCFSCDATVLRSVCSSCTPFAEVESNDVQILTVIKWIFLMTFHFDSLHVHANFLLLTLEKTRWLLLCVKDTVVLLLI